MQAIRGPHYYSSIVLYIEVNCAKAFCGVGVGLGVGDKYFLEPGVISDAHSVVLLIKFPHLSSLQKDASSALAHSGAHLDLSAFSSPEVSNYM